MNERALHAMCWPLEELGRALAILGHDRTTGVVNIPASAAPPLWRDPVTLDRWIGALASSLGLEAEREEVLYRDLDALTRRDNFILRLPGEDAPRFLAIAGRRRGLVRIIPPTLNPTWVSWHIVRATFCSSIEARPAGAIDSLLARVNPRKQLAAREHLLRELVGGDKVSDIWVLRPMPTASLWGEVRQLRIAREVAALILAHTLLGVINIGAWGLLGNSVLYGRLTGGWLVAWTLMLLTQVPLRMASTWRTGILSLRLGVMLKTRLMHGALRLAPDELKASGAGSMLGHVFESSTIEAAALNGGLQTALSLIDSLLAIVVISLGANPVIFVGLTLTYLAAVIWVGLSYAEHRRAWSTGRVALTAEFVERILGHRTRMAQLAPERWHEGEDEAIEAYHQQGRSHDAQMVRLTAMGRAWNIVGAIPIFISVLSDSASPARLAVALGGYVLVGRAIRRLVRGLIQLSTAIGAWRQIEFLLAAASRPELGTTTAGILLAANNRQHAVDQADVTRITSTTVLDAHDLSYRYRKTGPLVLDRLRLTLSRGDRVLLEGRSGSGKSTLASLLIGLREPEAGTVLLEGLDRATLGQEGWRRIVSAPQFHENHVFASTFAFNLLLGRTWPASSQDLTDAEQICRELGLAPLLKRMPAGLMQMLGESGWQLSHGERSRLYIARALLQNAEVVILDESFGALDPQNMEIAMKCVLRRCKTLVVIAHP